MWGGTSILFIALSAVSVAGEAWCSPRAILRGGGGLRPLAAGIVALRLRGGHMPDNIPTVDVDMDVEDRKRLHYDLDKDAASIASRLSYGSSAPNYGISSEDDGALDPPDGFPNDPNDWQLHHSFHIGFSVPKGTQFAFESSNEFALGELVVIRHPDGGQRFAKILDHMGGSFVTKENEGGTMYQLLVDQEPRPRGSTRMECASNIGKISPETTAHLDATCRVEAASWIRASGNAAFNSCHVEMALRKYAKAIAYTQIAERCTPEETKFAQTEKCHSLLNVAMCCLRLKKYQACADACREVLSLQNNTTKALYRLGVSLRKLGDIDGAKAYLQEVFRERPDDLAVRKELSLCYPTFQEYFSDINNLVPEQDDKCQNSSGRDPTMASHRSPPGWQEATELPHTLSSNNENNTRAAALLAKLAEEEGLADAQFNLACYHAQGIGVKVNHGEALRWYKRAAQQGHIRAQVNLALAMMQGVGCSQNETAAAEWMLKAAEQGDSRAQRTYGTICAQARGVQKDHREAALWYSKAARQNDTKAQFNLAVCYQEGTGVAADANKAAKWYWRAATLGDSQAMYNLGCCYSDGIGVAQDDSKAARWFAEAASRGFAPAIDDEKTLPTLIKNEDFEPVRNAPDQMKACKSEMASKPHTEEEPITKYIPALKTDTSKANERKDTALNVGDAISKDGASSTRPAGGIPPSIAEAIHRRAAKDGEAKTSAVGSSSSSKDIETLVGAESNMCKPTVGLRIRLAEGVRGNGVNGEKGQGIIQWVSKNGQVCHVRWDEATRFDYSYCCGHNTFHDLAIVGPAKKSGLNTGTVSDKHAPGTGSLLSENSDLAKIDNDGHASTYDWSIDKVQSFLEALRSKFGDKCDGYKNSFKAEDIDGPALLSLKEGDLKELGLSLGHRKIIVNELDALRIDGQSSGSVDRKEDSEPAFTGVVLERFPPSDVSMQTTHGDEISRLASLRSPPPLTSSLRFTDISKDTGNITPTADLAIDISRRDGGGEVDTPQLDKHGKPMSLFKQRLESLKGQR